MILTTADVIKLALQNGGNRGSNVKNGGSTVAGVADAIHDKTTNEQTSHNPTMAHSQKQEDHLPGLDLIGPVGTQQFIQSLRHFMRRDSFQLVIKEGAYRQNQDEDKSFNNSKKKRKPNKGSTDDGCKDYFMVQSIACTYSQSGSHDASKNDATHTTPGTSKKRLRVETFDKTPLQALSFLFTTPTIQGRFLADKAKELGIPPGPLYGQLKAGKGVTFVHPTNGKSVFVASSQVVEPNSPSLAVAVLYYPNKEVLQQLFQSPELGRFQTDHAMQSTSRTSSPEDHEMEIMVHIAPRSIFTSDECTSWRTSFGTSVRHIFIACEACIGPDETSTSSMIAMRSTANLSPYQAASVGALLRSLVAPGIYTNPVHESVIQTGSDIAGNSMQLPIGNNDAERTNNKDYCEAIPMLEYVLLPRTKRGFRHRDLFVNHWKELHGNAKSLLQSTECMEVARQQLYAARDDTFHFESNSISTSKYHGEILFTGTGSAIPCKHRNVSGIYLGMTNGNSMLLDVGEGTVGQLLRAKHNETMDSVLQHIKAVWISHPHADHHLGLLRLLADRKRTSHDSDDPLIVIAPPNLLAFLKEYESVVPAVAGSYSFLDCRDLVVSRTPSESCPALLQRLHSTLGVTSATAIPVAHCSHSFAVVFAGTSFGSVAYSGDCRPSTSFAETARDADVLIHEATFADGLEADAVLKKHCTVGEALRVGHEMNAKTIVLTHFSQRYPRIPLLPAPDATTGEFSGMTVIPAFDFMSITPFNIGSAARITPALQLLYPESPPDNETSEAQNLLSVPGLFAQMEFM
jgi:ribonuclease Z